MRVSEARMSVNGCLHLPTQYVEIRFAEPNLGAGRTSGVDKGG
jgi:hypothetical protein